MDAVLERSASLLGGVSICWERIDIPHS